MTNELDITTFHRRYLELLYETAIEFEKSVMENDGALNAFEAKVVGVLKDWRKQASVLDAVFEAQKIFQDAKLPPDARLIPTDQIPDWWPGKNWR